LPEGRGVTRLGRAGTGRTQIVRAGIARLAGIVALAALFASCATAPFSFRNDPLSLLGEGADAWLIVPVQANRRLLEIVAAKNPGLGASDRALDRTETLYAGIYGGVSSDGSAPAASLRLIATGSFPKSARSVVFPKSRGWVRSDDDAWGPWYALDGVGASIPEPGLYCMADKAALPPILRRIAKGAESAVALPPALESFLVAPASDGRIALFIDKPRRLVEAILPPEADFGIEDILVFARPNGATGAQEAGGETAVNGAPDAKVTEMYSLSARISVADARSSRALAALLRIILNCRATAADNGVIVSDCELSAERLADLAGFFYF